MDPPRVRAKQQKGQAVGFPAASYSELACERHVDGRVKAEEPCAGSGFQCIIQLDHVHSSPPPLASAGICPLLSFVTLSSAFPSAVSH